MRELFCIPDMGLIENNMDRTECIGRVVKWGLFLAEQDIFIDENSIFSSIKIDFGGKKSAFDLMCQSVYLSDSPPILSYPDWLRSANFSLEE
jgi:hypothetical protein